ncbi:hypothetical protein ACIA59_20075 [Micromonospora haikouensis]|uniref:hypothetical protein n=1 Tax=Micromonospora haikouensis TaxID=686309 RepID=UPI00379C25F9
MTTKREVSFPEMSEEQRRVHRAGEALHRDGASPAGAMDLLAAIVEDRTWERVTDGHGRSYEGRFREFVEAKAPYGLGYDPDQLPKILELRHPHESLPEVASRMEGMRQEVKLLLGAEVPAASSPGGDRRSSSFQACDTSLKPDRKDQVLARLKRDAPELAERVVAGEVTANAAARQMGWRHPRIVVSSPGRVADSLRRAMNPEDLARLVEILSGDP